MNKTPTSNRETHKKPKLKTKEERRIRDKGGFTKKKDNQTKPEIENIAFERSKQTTMNQQTNVNLTF